MVQVCVKLPQSNDVLQEHAIIELQGELESKQNLGLAGSFVGDLHFTKDDTPVLIIGHHILYGKCISLDKPLAVMKKSQSNRQSDDQETNESRNTIPTEYVLQAVVKKKLIFKTRPKPIIVNVPKKI